MEANERLHAHIDALQGQGQEKDEGTERTLALLERLMEEPERGDVAPTANHPPSFCELGQVPFL
jgi:hypothetical protein